MPDISQFSFTFKDVIHTLKFLLLIFLLGASWFFLKQTEFGKMLSNYDWIRIQLANYYLGPIFFIFIGGAIVGIGFPRLALSALGGFVFGFSVGIAYSLLATMVGCFIAFYYSKYLGRSFIEKRLPGRMKKLDVLLREHSFTMTLAVRLFPIGNNLLTNVVAGVSAVKAAPFFMASFLGFIPQTIIFVLIGSGVREDFWVRGTLSIALFLLSIVILMMLLKKIKNRA